MVVQCPQCEAWHLFDESDLIGLTQLEERCSKCQTSFVVRVPSIESTGASKAPANLKRSETITVTAERTKLPLGKRVSLMVLGGLMKGEVF